MSDALDHDLNDINPHRALWLSENYVSPTDRAWEKWTAKVERILGHDLDGNEDIDGYSLDGANAAFEAGETPEAYAKEVRDAQSYEARAGGR